MRILVTGARGLLGAAVIRELSRDLDVVPLDRAALDITNPAAVRDVLTSARPDAVVNCAGYNNVDGAEEDPRTALDVNAFSVRALSAEAQRLGAILVHYSSDFVFDGETDRPYREDDRPNPRGTYAASKLLGDWFALEHPQGYVLRVESLFGAPPPGGSREGSLGTIVTRLRAREPVPVFIDRTVSPTYTADLAIATRGILTRRPSPGLYHAVNTGAATWKAIAAEAARVLGLPFTPKEMTLESAALRAPRPRYCALSNAKLAAAGIPMPAWQDALRRHLSSV
jgi:dTDP-4-dehydrorhamnose reductase